MTTGSRPLSLPSGKLIYLLNMAIEIVSFPIKNGGSFHRFLYVYQVGYPVLPQALTMNQSSTGPKLEGSGDVQRSNQVGYIPGYFQWDK